MVFREINMLFFLASDRLGRWVSYPSRYYIGLIDLRKIYEQNGQTNGRNAYEDEWDKPPTSPLRV